MCTDGKCEGLEVLEMSGKDAVAAIERFVQRRPRDAAAALCVFAFRPAEPMSELYRTLLTLEVALAAREATDAQGAKDTPQPPTEAVAG